jgi:hypothetical protein
MTVETDSQASSKMEEVAAVFPVRAMPTGITMRPFSPTASLVRTELQLIYQKNRDCANSGFGS